MYQYSYLVEVLLSQFEWNSRDSPTETRLTDRYRSTDSLSFVTPANFPRTVTVRRMANDVTYTMYAALPIHLRVQSMVCVCVNNALPNACLHAHAEALLLCVFVCKRALSCGELLCVSNLHCRPSLIRTTQWSQARPSGSVWSWTSS